MDTIIHYFTGTGNTLHAVRMIQDRLKKAGHKVTIQRISYGVRSPEAEFGLHVIAFPTYSWTAPAVVQDYIRRMPDGQGRKAAVFTTYGGNPLGAPEFIHRKLKARGYDVMITGGALYPDNWTQMVNPPDKAKAGQMIKQGEKMTREFAEKLIKGQRSYFKHSFLNWFWTGVIGSLFILFGRRGMGLLFYADSGCNSCGICEKTCPVQNIRMKGNKNPRPVWKFSCEDCCRCINVCPKNAVNTSLLRTGAMCIVFIAGILILFKMLPQYLSGQGTFLSALIIALAVAVLHAAVISVQFFIINPFLWFLERRPGSGTYLDWSHTKKFNRYMMPGFKPLKEE